MSRTIARSAMDQLSGRPVYIAPQYAGWHVGVDLGTEVTSGPIISDIRDLAAMAPASSDDLWQERRLELSGMYGGTYADAQDKPFAYANGKAIIPIHGMLINRYSWSWPWATGYNFVRNQIEAAMADPDVDGIVYDVNSYGGLCAGCIETSDLIYQASARNEGGKPSIAMVDANCFSAAYMLACSADQIAVTPSGMAGSIGVLVMHMDVSKMMDDFGVKVTFIQAGANKTLGNPYEPLSADAKDRFQSIVDQCYTQFSDAVVRGRDMTAEAVQATEAGCFLAAEALSLGLIDAILNPDDAVEAFFNGDTSDVDPEDDQGEDPPEDDEDEPMMEGNQMTLKPAATSTPKADAEMQRTIDAAAAQQQAAQAQAVAEAAASERARIKGIQTHAEAAGRTALANHLAHNTTMTVEEAGAILAASAKETPAAVAPAPAPAATETTTNFQRAMDTGRQPNVGAGGGAMPAAEQEENLSPAQKILRNQQKATGVKPREEQRRVN